MTGKELLKMFEVGKKITIRFTEEIEETEGMFSKNMMADIVNIHKDDDYLVIKVDQTKYYESNKQFDTPTWLNKGTGVYDLTYSQYREQYGQKVHMREEIYDNYEGELYNFTVIESETKEIYQKYLDENSEKTYIEWLEDIILNKIESI